MDLFARLSVNVVAGELMRDFNVDATVASTVFGSAFFYAYAIMQVPHGFLLDRFGPKRLVSSACFCTFLGTIIFAYSETILLALIGRVIAGIGSGAAWLGTVKVINLNFGHVDGLAENFFGVSIALGQVGGLLSQSPFRSLAGAYGWRHAYVICSFCPFLLSLSIAYFVDDDVYKPMAVRKSLLADEGLARECNNQPYVTLPEGEGHAEGNSLEETSANEESEALSLRQLLCSRNLWVFGLYLGGCDAPFESIAGLWGETYLVSIQKLSSFQSGLAISFLVFISGIAGLGYGVYLTGTTPMRTKINLSVVAALISLVGSLMLTFCVEMDLWVIYLSFFFVGQASGGLTGLWCMVPYSELCNGGRLGIVSGIVNTICIFVDALAQMLFGIVLDLWWSGEYVPGNSEKVRSYGVSSFIPAMSLLTCLFVIASASLFFYRK